MTDAGSSTPGRGVRLGSGLPFFLTALALGLFAVVAESAVRVRTGAAVNLVLLIVVAVATIRGARYGAVTGFWAGLVTDLAPASVHATGTGALALCLAGYIVGIVWEPHQPPEKRAAVGDRIRHTLSAVGAGLIVLLCFTIAGGLLGVRLRLPQLLEMLGATVVSTALLGALLLPSLVRVLRRWC